MAKTYKKVELSIPNQFKFQAVPEQRMDWRDGAILQTAPETSKLKQEEYKRQLKLSKK